MDWDAASTRDTATTPAARVFRGTRQILSRRRATPGLHSASPTVVCDSGNAGLLCVARRAPTGTILCAFNFTETWKQLSEPWARAQGVSRMHDALSDAPVQTFQGHIALPPYARVWLT